ncbi:MAG: hypothetical protein J1F35_05815 [Erysipelotrichales bacterium]|nr:hypothetical protein [Erysipelotrichales bacterium]
MKLFKVIETSYHNFDNSIRAYLSKTLSDAGYQYSKSNIFGLVFEGIKGVLQNMMFYIEDAFTEQNVYTATRKKSIFGLARLSGYEAFYGSAASGTFVISNFVTNGLEHSNSKIYLKNGAIIKNATTGLDYIALLPLDFYIFDLAKPLVTHEIKVVQGTWKNHSYTAKGNPLESFEIAVPSLYDKEYIEVTVDGEKYTQAACLYDMTENSKEFVLTIGFEKGFSVMFGNGVHGKQLLDGQNISVRYIAHNGDLGNIDKSSATGFFIASGVVDAYGNKVDGNKYLRIKMSNYISGGTDADTMEEIQTMIGYQSRNLVLATEDNFKLFLKRFSFIGQTNIWTEKNSLAVTVSSLSNKKSKLTSPEEYLELEPSELLLTDNQKEMVLHTLNNSNKIFGGMSMKFQDPIISKYAIICYVKIPSDYQKDSISTQIRNVLATYFMELSYNVYFIAKSDLIKKVIDEIPDIQSFDLEIISEENEKAYKNGIYYDYELKFVNGTYQYQEIKKIYDLDKPVGLDLFGNISITSKLKVPVLHGPITYYYNKGFNPDKQKMNTDDNLTAETIQIIWI